MKTLKFFLLCSLFIFACGSPEPEEKAAEQISDALKDLKEGLGDAANDMEGDLGDAMAQISDAVKDINAEGVSNKKPVNFRKLKELLPEEANGFERTKSSGESTGALGFKVSTTKATYEKDDQRIEVDLVDAGGFGSAFMGLAAWSMIDMDKETDNGFERTINYEGNKAYEKCENSRCEFAVVVGKRFLLTVKGRNVEMDELRAIVDDIGLNNLEDLKDTFGE
jgi:hypothetical protein